MCVAAYLWWMVCISFLHLVRFHWLGGLCGATFSGGSLPLVCFHLLGGLCGATFLLGQPVPTDKVFIGLVGCVELPSC